MKVKFEGKQEVIKLHRDIFLYLFTYRPNMMKLQVLQSAMEDNCITFEASMVGIYACRSIPFPKENAKVTLAKKSQRRKYGRQ